MERCGNRHTDLLRYQMAGTSFNWLILALTSDIFFRVVYPRYNYFRERGSIACAALILVQNGTVQPIDQIKTAKYVVMSL